MNQPPTPAARYLADLQKRGVTVELIKNNSVGADSIVSPYEIQMSGGRMLAGDWDKVKLHKRGLVLLLQSSKAFGMSISDWGNATSPTPYALNDVRGLGPQYRDKAGDEVIGSEMFAPEPVFAPMDESKPRPKPSKSTKLIVLKPKVIKEVKVKAMPKPRLPHHKGAPNRCQIEIGRQYKFWTVLAQLGRTRGGYIEYRCECVCGKVRTIEGSRLLQKDVSRSCGCQNRFHVDHNWDETDWTKSSAQIARELKCSANTVSYYREKLAPETMPRKNRSKPE